MNPWQLAKDTEHSHQRAFFAFLQCAVWFGFGVAMNENGYSLQKRQLVPYQPTMPPVPALAFAYAIPNGGKRDALTGAMMKAEGVKRGAPDVCLPVTNSFAGLYLEFKKPSAKPKIAGAGGVRESQSDYHTFLRSQHYRVEVVYSWIEAANIVMDYMGERSRIPE